MVFKIDMDGVIRDMFYPMLCLYNNRYGENLSLDDIVEYDVNVVFPKCMEIDGIRASEFFFGENSREVFLDGSFPYEGVAYWLNELRKYGHRVVIVTMQYGILNKEYALRFLDRYNIGYDDIMFTSEKWMVSGDYLVDDNPLFLEDPRDNSAKVVIDMPYNREVSAGKRYGSLVGFIKEFLERKNENG